METFFKNKSLSELYLEKHFDISIVQINGRENRREKMLDGK